MTVTVMAMAVTYLHSHFSFPPVYLYIRPDLKCHVMCQDTMVQNKL